LAATIKLRTMNTKSLGRALGPKQPLLSTMRSFPDIPFPFPFPGLIITHILHIHQPINQLTPETVPATKSAVFHSPIPNSSAQAA